MDEIYNIIDRVWTLPGDFYTGAETFKALFHPEEESFVTLPEYHYFTLAGAIIVALVLLLYLIAHRRVRPVIGPGTCIWVALFEAGLIWLTVWIDKGLCSAPLSVVLAYAGVLTAGGSLAVFREIVFTHIDEYDMAPGQFRFIGRIIRIVRDIPALVLAIAMSFIALEIPNNPSWLDIKPEWVTLSLVVIAFGIVALYFVSQRRGGGIWLGVAFCGFVGLASYFVYLFRGTPLSPGDALALGTAGEVMDQYEFVFNANLLWCIIACAIAAIPCVFVRPPKRRPRTRNFLAPAWNIPLAVLAFIGFAYTINVPDYQDDYDTEVYFWAPQKSYELQGFVPTFVTELQLMDIEEPEGYTDEDALALQTQLANTYDVTIGASEARNAAVAQFNELQPCVVVVMNESFADLSIIQGLGVGYEGPEYFNYGLNDALYKGVFPVSAFGGGTCNTEFEFFTSTSFGYIGGGKYPYQLYNMSDVDTVPRQMAELGYETTAIHCDAATNWNRNRIYPQLGFDRFLDIESFPEDAERLRGLVRDRETYDMVLDILRTTDSPQFIWDLTEAGHGGYYRGGIPEDLWYEYPLADVVGADKAYAGNEYLAVIKACDEDLQYFIDELRYVERPVVVVFFGDHQPSISSWFTNVLTPELSGFESGMLLNQTSYAIWANYDVAGIDEISNYDIIDASQIAAITLNAIGAPLSDYQKAQLVEHNQIHAINKFGYLDEEGIWHAIDDDPSEWTQAYTDMNFLTYFNFATRI